MSHRLAGLSLMSVLAFAASARADESPEPSTPLILPADSSKILASDLAGARSSKAVTFENATPAVRLAMCGVEADAGNTDLDAGLIDFKTPDPHAAGRSYDDRQSAGGNVPDYRSSVFLGVTLGYHF